MIRYFPFSCTPRRKHRDYRRVRPQREFRHHESRRCRNAHEVDEDGLVIQRVQVRQKPERAFTGAQDFQHRARGREFVDRLVTKPRANAIDKLLDLRIIKSSNEKSERMSKK